MNNDILSTGVSVVNGYKEEVIFPSILSEGYVLRIGMSVIPCKCPTFDNDILCVCLMLAFTDICLSSAGGCRQRLC